MLFTNMLLLSYYFVCIPNVLILPKNKEPQRRKEELETVGVLNDLLFSTYIMVYLSVKFICL